MKHVICYISLVCVFVIFDNYFRVESHAVYAMLGFMFRIYQEILDIIFDKPC